MIEFNSKYGFRNSENLAAVVAETLGATIHADGSFEAACDGNGAIDGGTPLPIADGSLIVRVTAKTDLERTYWAWKILAAAGEGASLDTTERGYWGPTNEYEPSWKITSPFATPTPDLIKQVYGWLVVCDQQSVYFEYGGKVLIVDTVEVPTVFALEMAF